MKTVLSLIAALALPSIALADAPAGTIEFSKTADGAAATSFKSSDTVFVRAKLSRSLDEAYKAKGTNCTNRFFVWSADVDGKRVKESADRDGFYWIKPKAEDFAKWTALETDQLMGKSDDGRSMTTRFREIVAPSLTAGEHEIKISVKGQCEDHNNNHQHAFTEDLATGTVKITVGKNEVIDIMPKPGMKDAKVVKDAMALLVAEWKPDTILKLVIVSKAWNVEMVEDDFGRRVPKRRTVETIVAVKQKDVCRLFEVRLEQPAKSKTAFGATAIAGTGGNRDVDCAGIK